MKQPWIRAGWALALCLLIAPSAPAADPAPQFVCDEPLFDFGSRDSGDLVEHDFEIRNAGDLTLEILKAKPSCGCTVANISDREIPPGGTATITAKLNLKGRDGNQHKTIMVESNDPAAPRATLTMKGTAVSAVSVAPRSVIVPNLSNGEPHTTRIRVSSREDTPLALTDLHTGHDKISATVEPVDGENAVDLVVVAAGDLPRGSTFGRLSARTNSPKKPTLNIPFRYTVVGELAIYPQEITMVSQAQAVTRILTISPGQVKEFNVESVDVPVDGMQAQIQSLNNNRYRVVVSNIVPDLALNGKSLTIHTTAQNMETVAVPFKIIKRN